MDSGKNIKEIVREKYAQIVVDADKGEPSSCCGGSKTNASSSCGCGGSELTDFSDDYTKLNGYNADADLNLGCGVPTKHAGIKEGDTVVDLGSGAGNDVFVTRAIVGDSGKVIGLDMTEEMIAKAEKNNAKLGYKNVEFKLGEIEDIPLPDNFADVVISNCVLNLVPDKKRAFGEIYRVLKKSAHFCISDIVTKGELPESVKKSAELYAGCVSGAMKEEDYLGVIEAAGFTDISIKIRKVIDLPDEIFDSLNESEINKFKNGEIGLSSITVTANKK
jgi:SAM-dependent methyltransferase